MEIEIDAQKNEEILEDAKLQKKKDNNIKIYPIYRIFSWDLLFYYAIIYLFITVEKNMTPAQFLQLDAFYLFSKLLMQIPCTLFIQRVGKKRSLVVANFIGGAHILVMMFATSFNVLLISQLLCAIAFIIKSTCDSDMLYDSLKHNEKRGGIFSRIDGSAVSKFYYIDAISAVIASFLFVVNPYIPMFLCFLTFVFTFYLSLKFEEIHPERGRMHVREEIKNIRYGFRNIVKSGRLRNLLLFNAVFIGLIGVLRNLRNTVLVEVGLPEQYFGIIFALMGISLGIATKFQGKIHNRFKNKTLTFLTYPTVISCILTGIVIMLKLKFEVTIAITVVFLVIQCVTKGPYYVLIKRYFNNFTTSEKRIQIATANNLCENLIASLLIYGASFVLDFTTVQNTMIMVGLVFLVLFVLLLDSMRKTVGLKPEQYSEKEIL